MTVGTTDAVEFGAEAPTSLYRLYAKDKSLLYVGITGNLRMRLAQHAVDKPWWHAVARKTATLYPTRKEALVAEALAIRAERPQHNIHHAGAETPRDARNAVATMAVPDPSRGVTVDDLTEAFRGFIHATEYDVRQWHARMVTTRTDKLGLIFSGSDGRWWDISPQLMAVLDGPDVA